MEPGGVWFGFELKDSGAMFILHGLDLVNLLAAFQGVLDEAGAPPMVKGGAGSRDGAVVRGLFGFSPNTPDH